MRLHLVRVAHAILAVALVAACASVGRRSDAEIARIVADADWNRTIDVHITLRDSGFLPRELQLKAGQPYRLTIENQGAHNHYFNAPEFLATVAARKAQVTGFAEIKAPHFSSFELFAKGGTMEFYFVPLEKGSYRAFCHLGNHAEMGVEGQLIVE